MPMIRCLDKHVAELIAAGEVVERPASVVKELLENAIDAGASAIQIEIQRGGLSFIRVTDNGCGIAPEQLPVAFLRHATSKLNTAEDLEHIGTLGFRGEALASICAVSRVDIFSGETGSSIGAKLHIEGGEAGAVEECGCPEGTTIIVRDLFYNMPARMKYMKKDAQEGSMVTGIAQHVALSHPEISFRMIKDSEEILHTPGDGQKLSAIYAVFGRIFAKDLLQLHGESGGITVDGFITKPINFHGTRNREVFFVNGRYVKPQLLSIALEEGYKNQMMKGKFPGCVLNITMPLDRVDVNVHPAKTVVKFLDEKEIFDAVHYTVMDTLEKDRKPVQSEESFFKSMTAKEYRESIPAVKTEEKKPLGSYTAEKVTDRPIAEVKEVPVKNEEVQTKPCQEPVQEKPPLPATEKKAEPETPAVQTTAEHGTPAVQTVAEPEVPAFKEETKEQITMEKPVTAHWKIVGEVLRTYIICEDDRENMWIVDKHAAHERIRFDALKRQDVPIMSQQLLVPVTVDLDAEEYNAMIENKDTVDSLGFLCEDFGEGTILVREVPAEIRAEDTSDTIEELAHKLVLGRADPKNVRDELYHTIACKSAIKAGMKTDMLEMKAIIEKVETGEVQYCPHGRPVKYQMSKYQIEKLFKRS